MVKPRSDHEQCRKFLIVFEPESDLFVVQSCNKWRRVGASKASVDPDDPNFNCKVISAEDRVRMLSAWDASSQLANFKKWSDAQNATKEPPPSLKEQRKERAKTEAAAAKKVKDQALKEAKLADRKKLELIRRD